MMTENDNILKEILDTYIEISIKEPTNIIKGGLSAIFGGKQDD